MQSKSCLTFKLWHRKQGYNNSLYLDQFLCVRGCTGKFMSSFLNSRPHKYCNYFSSAMSATTPSLHRIRLSDCRQCLLEFSVPLNPSYFHFINVWKRGPTHTYEDLSMVPSLPPRPLQPQYLLHNVVKYWEDISSKTAPAIIQDAFDFLGPVVLMLEHHSWSL